MTSILTAAFTSLISIWILSTTLMGIFHLPWISETVLLEVLAGFWPISFMNFSEITLMDDPESTMRSIVQPYTRALHKSGVKVAFEGMAALLPKWTCLAPLLWGVMDFFNSFLIRGDWSS